jgi:hypothetical protein
MSFYLPRQMFLSFRAISFSRGDNFAENYFNLYTFSAPYFMVVQRYLSVFLAKDSGEKLSKKESNNNLEVYLNINKVRVFCIHIHLHSLWPLFSFVSTSKVLQLKFLAHFYESLFDLQRQTSSTNGIPFDTDTYNSLPTENEKLYLSHNGRAQRINFIILKFGVLCVLLCVFIPNIICKQTPEIMNPS